MPVITKSQTKASTSPNDGLSMSIPIEKGSTNELTNLLQQLPPINFQQQLQIINFYPILFMLLMIMFWILPYHHHPILLHWIFEILLFMITV
jgi:hypothetical protein